jgi:hypothetical protein
MIKQMSFGIKVSHISDYFISLIRTFASIDDSSQIKLQLDHAVVNTVHYIQNILLDVGVKLLIINMAK